MRIRPALTLVFIFVLLAKALLGGASVAAHDVPSESVMNAFFKVEGDRAHLVVRVPLILLGTMSFPANAQRELNLAEAGPAAEQSLAAIGKEIVLRENGVPLVPAESAGRLALPSDRSFSSYDDAVAHVASPLAAGTTIYADQGFFDAHFTYAIEASASDFSVQTMLVPSLGNNLKLLIRYMPLDGPIRAYELTTGSGEVALDPRWHQAGRVFLRQGFLHILGGIDHLLFLLCLVIPFRRLHGLLPVVTTFTLAHSVTLIAAAYGIVPGGSWFFPLVETLIAASILYMALENIVAADLRRRWAIAGAFGLVHGFGFSSGLAADFQFAGSHLLLSLLAFNIGIEIGQLLVLLVALPALRILFGRVAPGRIGVVIVSALIAHTGWHWMVERANGLRSAGWSFEVAVAAVSPTAWAAALLLCGGAFWLVATRLAQGRSVRPGPVAPVASRLGDLFRHALPAVARRVSAARSATQPPEH